MKTHGQTFRAASVEKDSGLQEDNAFCQDDSARSSLDELRSSSAISIQMTPEQILQEVYENAAATVEQSVVGDEGIRERIDYVCRCIKRW